MNTLQIIAYFRFLGLYLPDFLIVFLQSLTVVSFEIDIEYIDENIEKIVKFLHLDKDFGLMTNDEVFNRNEISSFSIFMNISSILILLTQGWMLWCLAYALKAKFVTVPNINKPQRHKTKPTDDTLKSLKLKEEKDYKSSTRIWIEDTILQ